MVGELNDFELIFELAPAAILQYGFQRGSFTFVVT